MERFSELYNLLESRNDSKREETLIKMLLDMIAIEQDDEIHGSLMQKIMELYSEQNKELQKNYEEIKRLSTIDPLTQIYNRLKFMGMMNYEINRFKRYRIPLSLIMFDIDHFKLVNDTYGHDVGDDVLVTLSTIVSNLMRETDTFARWGGEEFMILLANAPIEAVQRKAETLRYAIESYNFNKVNQITCSFGVTTYLVDEIESVFTKRVDDALYESKHNGRNKVTVL